VFNTNININFIR